MSPARFSAIAPEDMSEAQHAVAKKISAGPRGTVRGPFRVLLHNPDLARPVQALGEHLRFQTGLPPELIELIVLLTARHWNCQYEWYAHEAIARSKTSLAPAIIEAIQQGQEPPGMTRLQADVHAFCRVLHRGAQVSDAQFEAVERHLGRAGVLDVIALAGYYSMLAMVLNVARVPLPDGGTPPLAPL